RAPARLRAARALRGAPRSDGAPPPGAREPRALPGDGARERGPRARGGHLARRVRQDRPRAARLRARGGGRGGRPSRGGGGAARAPRGREAPPRHPAGGALGGDELHDRPRARPALRGGLPPPGRRGAARGRGVVPRGRRVAARVPRGGADVRADRARASRRAPRREHRGLRRDPRGRAGGVPMRLRWIVLLALAALPACRREEAVESTAVAAERRLTPAQLSFLKFAPVAEVEATSLADLSGTIEFDEEH